MFDIVINILTRSQYFVSNSTCQIILHLPFGYQEVFPWTAMGPLFQIWGNLFEKKEAIVYMELFIHDVLHWGRGNFEKKQCSMTRGRAGVMQKVILHNKGEYSSQKYPKIFENTTRNKSPLNFSWGPFCLNTQMRVPGYYISYFRCKKDHTSKMQDCKFIPPYQ